MDGVHFDAVRAVLATREDVLLAIVFGSCAKGSAGPSSDLDLALLTSEALSLADEARLVDDVERAVGRVVDLVRLERTEDIILRREIGLSGIAVREALPGAFSRFRAEAQLAWLELEPLYRDAEARFLRKLALGAVPPRAE